MPLPYIEDAIITERDRHQPVGLCPTFDGFGWYGRTIDFYLCFNLDKPVSQNDGEIIRNFYNLVWSFVWHEAAITELAYFTEKIYNRDAVYYKLTQGWNSEVDPTFKQFLDVFYVGLQPLDPLNQMTLLQRLGEFFYDYFTLDIPGLARWKETVDDFISYYRNQFLPWLGAWKAYLDNYLASFSQQYNNFTAWATQEIARLDQRITALETQHDTDIATLRQEIADSTADYGIQLTLLGNRIESLSAHFEDIFGGLAHRILALEQWTAAGFVTKTEFDEYKLETATKICRLLSLVLGKTTPEDILLKPPDPDNKTLSTDKISEMLVDPLNTDMQTMINTLDKINVPAFLNDSIGNIEAWDQGSFADLAKTIDEHAALIAEELPPIPLLYLPPRALEPRVDKPIIWVTLTDGHIVWLRDHNIEFKFTLPGSHYLGVPVENLVDLLAIEPFPPQGENADLLIRDIPCPLKQ